jgi:hypothetical protein
MLEDSRKRTLEDLIPRILNILAQNPLEQVEAKKLALDLVTEVEEVNRCLEEMKYLKLIDLHTGFGPHYAAQITPIGLANLHNKSILSEGISRDGE